MSVRLAREGKLDSLFESYRLNEDEGARELYKWLSVAEDFGHDASEEISDLLETSSLRYDDDGYEQAGVHWELARAYLLGEQALPADVALAEKHLDRWREPFVLEELKTGSCIPSDAPEIRAMLEGDALSMFEGAIAPDPHREALRRMERVHRLREIGSVPRVILQHEAELLMEALHEWIGDLLPKHE